MKITINIPARLARDVIGGAHCGYWLDDYQARVRADGSGLYIGAPVKRSEADTVGPTVPVPRAFIGAAAIAEGLRLMLSDKSKHFRQIAARVLCNDGDGPDMDAVLQFAAYGKCVWG